MTDFAELLKQIEPLNYGVMEKVQVHLDDQAKPKGSLGILETLAKQVAGITQKESPFLNNKVIFTFAGDHGVTEEGVSAFPKEVTKQMVFNFIAGGAGINVLARHIGARVVVADLGVAGDFEPSPLLVSKKVGYGTNNMVKGPAMTRDEALKAIMAGVEIFEAEFAKGIDIVGTGEMGIGNTTPSSAIAAVMTCQEVEAVTGKGTGISDEALINKVATIKKAIALNQPDKNDPLDVLSKVGGFEIGGLVGVILAAASRRVPVVVDGFISSAASIIAVGLASNVKDYLIASHCSQEKGHRVIMDYLGQKPMFDLGFRLGEGTGAALGIGLVEAGVKVLNEVATFSKAGVSKNIS